MTCSHCGQEIADESKFCTHCGTAVTTNISLPASWGKRLGNHILDRIIATLLAVAAFIATDYVPTREIEILMFVLGILLYLLYYPLLEYFFGQTIGKMITGTKVVRRDGNKIHFWQAIGRTLARYIPLEPLSFTFRKFPTGWHDLLSKTYVVKKDMTPDQIRSIDPKVVAAHKSSTAIVIVIVIALVILVIGILSSVVLASLSTARSKGQEAAKRADIVSLQAKAELYAGEHNDSFVGFCQTDDIKSLSKYQTNVVTYECNDSEKQWVVTVPVGINFACIDSTGTTPTLVPITIGSRLSCPTVGTWTPITSADGSFTVEFPGEVLVSEEKNIQATTEDLSIVYDSTLYTLKAVEGNYMLIHHAYNKPFTAKERVELLPDYVDQLVSLSKGVITSEVFKDGVEKSQADFELVASAEKEAIHVRIIMTKADIYMLINSSAPDVSTEESYDYFRDSFKLIK